MEVQTRHARNSGLLYLNLKEFRTCFNPEIGESLLPALILNSSLRFAQRDNVGPRSPKSSNQGRVLEGHYNISNA